MPWIVGTNPRAEAVTGDDGVVTDGASGSSPPPHLISVDECGFEFGIDRRCRWLDSFDQ